MIEQVESFGTELQMEQFRDSCILDKRHVVTPQPWSVDGTAMFVARSAAAGHVSESGGIEPLLPIMWGVYVRIADLIGTWSCYSTVIRRPTDVEA